MNKDVLNFSAVSFDDTTGVLTILDQTLLPNEVVYREHTTKETVWDAIHRLEVRGAPAIGIAGAYGVLVGVWNTTATTFDAFYESFKEAKAYLDSSRPTAVNLSWGLKRMEACVLTNQEKSIPEILEALTEEAHTIKKEDEIICRTMADYGLTLFKPNMGIMTHCNAGTIATAKYGTSLGPLYVGHEQGYDFKVFVNETRPLLQGSRLTAWELHEAGLDVTLICDNMASIVMSEGKIDAIVVGADRVAANGDTANKIGTSGLGVLAAYYNIPLYVFAPLSTIDRECQSGADIHIELRDGSEIYKKWYEKPMAPEGIGTYNPAFDVTVAKHITAIITEKGILYPPYNTSIEDAFNK